MSEDERNYQRADEARDQKSPGSIEKWGDLQQYHSEPHGSYAGPQSGVMPQVKLLGMTPDPLGAIGAMAAMYEGRVVRDLSELSHEDRVRYWHEVRSTHLDTPLEAVQFEFLLEGVDRSFTHQLVRKRVGAAYAQESLRFAVPGKLSESTSLPPSLQGTEGILEIDTTSDAEFSQQQRWRVQWDAALNMLDAAYHQLVSSGMPAEEARGLLPHCTATRVLWVVNLRSLLQEAGNRLCTQAQFHWKMVMGQVVREIRLQAEGRLLDKADEFQLIADAFKPVCYEMGRCPFKAGFDRLCSIRERVEKFSRHGVNSELWGNDYYHGDGVDVRGIRTEEWLLNPGAARKVQ
jgi:flavin-dependent thymidylate synthase